MNHTAVKAHHVIRSSVPLHGQDGHISASHTTGIHDPTATWVGEGFPHAPLLSGTGVRSTQMINLRGFQRAALTMVCACGAIFIIGSFAHAV